MLHPRAKGSISFIAAAGNYNNDEVVLKTTFNGVSTDHTMIQVRQ